MAIVNLGRKIEPVVGLSAVAVNSNGGGNMPSKVRYHVLKGKCVAVNYTGTGALATKKITGAGNNDCTTTLTIVNGQVTAAAVTVAGTGYVTGDTIQPVDPTGQGCVLTVTAAAGAVTALAVTNGGTQSPIDPVNFFASFLLKVKNAPFRAVSLDSLKRIVNARGIYPALGELYIEFTEIGRNMLQYNDSTSWDLLSGETFALQWKTLATLVNPNFTLEYEYDLQPNVVPDAKGNAVRVRNPIKYRETQINLNIGDNFFNRETLNTGGEPILRMWFLGATPGNISYIQLKSDSDIKLDGTVADINERYEKGGRFTFGRADFLNFNYPSSNTLKGQFNAPKYWDAGYIADFDGRLNEALVYNKLDLKLTSAVQQQCTVLIESAPGDFV
ncbi:MAG TPA: hypothetical protein VHC44_18745 [Verrucomicrobiae bacterium]|nr:hypothetical protein [Verrucomicrobiae bacterium]